MKILATHISEEQIDIVVLVLTAAGINWQIEKDGLFYTVLVGEADMDRAVDNLCRYVEENPSPANHLEFEPAPYGKSLAGIGMALCLLLIHAVLLHLSRNQFFRRLYDASSEHILSGEVYRAATALFLHQDAHHLLSNMLGISIFGSICCSMAGWGLGTFLILCSGILGNLFTAFFYGDVWHRSMGASTAVFGAVGLISGMAFLQKYHVPKKRFSAFLPLGSALVLLGFFSAGEHTDILAHLFGLVSGIALGGMWMAAASRLRPGKFQLAFLFAGIGIVALSFLSPLYI